MVGDAWGVGEQGRRFNVFKRMVDRELVIVPILESTSRDDLILKLLTGSVRKE